jgi:hypothetical protein
MIPIDSGPKLKHGENRRISKEKLTWADLSYIFELNPQSGPKPPIWWEKI